ncbi:MAG: collagen-like protein [Gemmatimonadetes bacterium]|nr:collagen-like protein [Gemmatimonadota bacterium]MBT7594929.1 collagen-like protein [Gemmatimonadota bacterium]
MEWSRFCRTVCVERRLLLPIRERRSDPDPSHAPAQVASHKKEIRTMKRSNRWLWIFPAMLLSATTVWAGKKDQDPCGDFVNPGNVIYACAKPDGKLRSVSCPAECKRNETDLTWSIMGPAGPAGADGVAGPQGLSGADGAAGAVGPAGAAGNDGADGADGLAGAQGPAGTDGSDGAAGPAGNDGADGLAGPQGLPGADGSDGATGATGPAGNDGADGLAGAQGPVGAQGPAGADGSDGATGATGPSGIIGSFQTKSHVPIMTASTSPEDIGLEINNIPGTSKILVMVNILGTWSNTQQGHGFYQLNIIDANGWERGISEDQQQYPNAADKDAISMTALVDPSVYGPGPYTLKVVWWTQAGTELRASWGNTPRTLIALEL